MDGTSPSGFTESTYTNGITITTPNDFEALKLKKKRSKEDHLQDKLEDSISCMQDLWSASTSWTHAASLIVEQPWNLLDWWCDE